ncbi:MAG: hypothetical protein JY451_09300 [Erythrobacter sp.]|nr:MAG: hypothetical protein JY451_09300 [Erythrobacter sp.]
MARATASSGEIKVGLKQDILWLLITIYSYNSRMRFDRIREMSREDLQVEAILLESASRDIVSRLAALDDDGKNNRSFQTLFSALKREGLDPSRTKDLDLKVKAFRQVVNGLKVSHRNSYIAHVATGAEVKPRVLDDPVDFAPAASLAVNLLDDIDGRLLSYFFRLGSDGSIDLRKVLAESA